MSQLDELHRARVALGLYGGHSSFCATDREPEMACDCGFAEEVGGEDPADGDATSLWADRKLIHRLDKDGRMVLVAEDEDDGDDYTPVLSDSVLEVSRLYPEEHPIQDFFATLAVLVVIVAVASVLTWGWPL